MQDTIKKQIVSIWEKYISDNKMVQDTKGNVLDNIDEKRLEAIYTLKIIIDDFVIGKIDIAEFKTNIDSFNKKNNLWGFTSIKGQMFFNLLLKTSETEVQQNNLAKLLRDCVIEPKDLSDALNKIDAMDKYTSNIFSQAPDKRKAPNPASVCYFLSYFWQIQNYQKWPIMYSSIIVSFTDIGLWTEQPSQKDAYQTFYHLNEEIKNILSIHTGRAINNWEAEHSFWNFRTVTAYPKQHSKSKDEKLADIEGGQTISVLKKASFNIFDFIPPITAKLIDLGSETESSSSGKGRRFEKAVCELFKQLGFYVQELGQGTGREPDLIAINKEGNVAFVIDAKAYANGYMLSASDERAIREYISHHCPKLKKEGINKIGFLIISNSFKPGFDSFINEITWKTDIKRFSLLSSEALLHLLAYKIKDQLPISEIIDAIISLGNNISAQDIIQKFDDV
ncbi:MAG: restriction endonuclease [Bacteroidales bacterium]|nr:restriction endonuclease [Bacteroidales bacterium]